MSLILEALRKSEAERRRGEIPGLHAELAPLAPVATAGRPAWLWWAVLIGSVAMVAAVWSWRGRSAAPAAVGSHGQAITTAVGAATAPDASLPAPAASAPSPASVPDRPSPGGAAAPGSDAAAASLAADSGEPLRAGRPVAAVPAPDAPSMDPPGTAQADAVDRRDPTPDVAAVPPRAAATPAEDGPATGPAARAVADPVRLADLSVAQRQMLPPLRMSMHMRGPTQRFAIIDGVRLAEGDRIGDAVVEEITGAGVVLDWQGMRLLVPVR